MNDRNNWYARERTRAKLIPDRHLTSTPTIVEPLPWIILCASILNELTKISCNIFQAREVVALQRLSISLARLGVRTSSPRHSALSSFLNMQISVRALFFRSQQNSFHKSHHEVFLSSPSARDHTHYILNTLIQFEPHFI